MFSMEIAHILNLFSVDFAHILKMLMHNEEGLYFIEKERRKAYHPPCAFVGGFGGLSFEEFLSMYLNLLFI